MESDEKIKPSSNPEGDPHGTELASTPETRSVSGDDAARAGAEATADEPVDREEIHAQSAYKDNSADAGQQAASAEEAKTEATSEE
jgi:hypothetical protein